MQVTKEQIGTPIFAGDAIKQSYRQSGKGLVVSFIINEEDMTSELATLKLGEVVRLFVTIPDIGA